jgi:hypothetical protein
MPVAILALEAIGEILFTAGCVFIVAVLTKE